jgi:hypothetical protein
VEAHVILAGSAASLARHGIDGSTSTTTISHVELDGSASAVEMLCAKRPRAAFFLDPQLVPSESLRQREFPTAAFVRAGVATRDEAEGLGRADFDRLIATHPAAAAETAFWRTVALPVADMLFRRPQTARGTARAACVGASASSTAAAAEILGEHGLRVVSQELLDSEALPEPDGVDVAVVAADGWPPGATERVAFHLAAGHVTVVAAAPHGPLEPGIDHLVLESELMLRRLAARIARSPDAFHRVRVRGRMKAELFRASRVFEMLGDDLLVDVATFG